MRATTLWITSILLPNLSLSPHSSLSLSLLYVFLTIDSLPAVSSKLPANAVRKKRSTTWSTKTLSSERKPLVRPSSCLLRFSPLIPLFPCLSCFENVKEWNWNSCKIEGEELQFDLTCNSLFQAARAFLLRKRSSVNRWWLNCISRWNSDSCLKE